MGGKSPGRKARAEIARLTKELDNLQLSHDEECADVASEIGDRFMLDPPDGGYVTLLEGAQRIASALSAAEVKVSKMREALERADQFITNGIELGFIRMPDESIPDPAHETPGIVRAALKE